MKLPSITKSSISNPLAWGRPVIEDAKKPEKNLAINGISELTGKNTGKLGFTDEKPRLGPRCPFMFRAFFSVRSQKDNREMHRQNREFASQVPMQNYWFQNGAIAALLYNSTRRAACGLNAGFRHFLVNTRPWALTIAQETMEEISISKFAATCLAVFKSRASDARIGASG